MREGRTNAGVAGRKTFGRGALGAGLALAVAAVAFVGQAPAPEPPPAVARPMVAGGTAAAAVRHGLGSLPAAARAAISTTLGAQSPGFAARREHRGYGLAGGGVSARLDGRGVVLHARGVSLSLPVLGIGRDGRLTPAAVRSVDARGNSVELDRGRLTEWYGAGPLGIEQGFTIRRRPVGRADMVTLVLRLPSAIRTRMLPSGTLLLGRPGTPSVSYGELSAIDAKGRPLRASLEVAARRLMIRVRDRDAAYPLTIDPLIQQGAKLVGSGQTAGPSEFGYSAALSGDGNTAVIGGPNDRGDQGAAWVFTRTGTTWTQQGPKLTASGEAGGALFGSAVALSSNGDTALIGAPGDGLGVVWAFTRSGGVWSQQDEALSASDVLDPGSFGSCIALSSDGNTALIGGPADGDFGAAWIFARAGGGWAQQGPKLSGDYSAGTSVALSADGSTALIGNPYAHAGGIPDRGSVSVYTRSSGGVWNKQGSDLVGSGEVGGGLFGWSVALSADGSTALIGGPSDNPSDDSSAGAAWVFTRSGVTWTAQGSKKTVADTVSFGWNVALSADGNTAVIGGASGGLLDFGTSVMTRSNGVWTVQGFTETGGYSFGPNLAISSDGTTVLVGDPFDNGDAGTSRVYTRSGGVLTQQGSALTGVGAAPAGLAGWSVALSADGNTALVGGPYDDKQSGAAWVFTRSGTTWTQQGPKLTGSGAVGAAEFGYSVALSGDGNLALVGGPADDGGEFTTGLGAVWAFTRSGGVWAQQGSKLTGAEASHEAGFGFSVALSADATTALVGGPIDQGGPGAAWVFTRSGSTWTQQGPKLQTGPICCSSTSWLGLSSALSADGNTAIVSGVDEDGLGGAWVFVRSGSAWSRQGPALEGSGEQQGGGYYSPRVALSADGNTALMGFIAGNDAVRAWAFTRSGTTWSQLGAELTGGDSSGGGDFAGSVALSADGQTALVGLPGDGGFVGAARLYTRSGSSWTQDGPDLVAADEQGDAGFGVSVALSADASTALIGGLADNGREGAAWAFTVAAPDAPTDVSAVAGDGQASVSFTAPPPPVGGFTVTASPGGATATGTASPIVVTGLTNGTPYTFTVTATNAGGTGPASAPSPAVVPAPPPPRPEAPPEPPAPTQRVAPPDPPAAVPRPPRPPGH